MMLTVGGQNWMWNLSVSCGDGRLRREITYPNLIRPVRLCHVSDPFYGLVVTLLEHLEEANEQSGRCEHDDWDADVPINTTSLVCCCM